MFSHMRLQKIHFNEVIFFCLNVGSMSFTGTSSNDYFRDWLG